MSLPRSLIEISDLSPSQVSALFALSSEFETQFTTRNFPVKNQNQNDPVLGFIFFEPSTRTRMSFETAALRMNYKVLHFGSMENSSLAKGESREDTCANIFAMGIDGAIVRCGDDVDLNEIASASNTPILNGGWGKKSHPTQALLDGYTIWKEFGRTKKLRVLVMGDLLHSRVAASNLKLFEMLEMDVRLYEPASLGRACGHNVPYEKMLIDDLNEGLKWADVVIGLRVQLERHSISMDQKNNDWISDYHQAHGLTKERLKFLSPQSIIMHPGPVNYGVEFSPEVRSDPRNRILKQVENGVLVRAALMRSLFHSQGLI
jgi:aspartate carbamoyltransferase catalytic subunit